MWHSGQVRAEAILTTGLPEFVELGLCHNKATLYQFTVLCCVSTNAIQPRHRLLSHFFACNFSNEQTPTLFFSTLSFSATMDWHLASDSLPQMSTKLLTNRALQFCLVGYSSCIYSNQVVRLQIQKTFFNFENPVWLQSEERKKETSVACFSHANMIHEIMISYVTTLCNINLTAC